MTNAIEQAKREMYDRLAQVKETIAAEMQPRYSIRQLESSLESYLELLRQDHEALHETARNRFEDLQVAEQLNKTQDASLKLYRIQTADLDRRLGNMTEERDSIQLRLHAVDHSYNEQQSRGATLASNSGENVASATLGGKTAAIQVAVVSIRKISDAWAMTGRRAKKSMLKISGILARPEVYTMLEEIENSNSYAAWFLRNDKCMHSFFAIGQDQMKCTFCGVGK